MAHLDALEPVRTRPAAYVGSTGALGLEVMMAPIVSLCVAEHLADRSSLLSVDISEQGSVTVAIDGQGFSIQHDDRFSEPRLKTLFSRFLHPDIPQEPAAPSHAVRHPSHELFPAVATALSSQLEVETRVDGRSWRLSFASGALVQGLTDTGSTSERGAVIRYQPDAEIFDADAKHDLDAIERRLRNIALLCPKLDVRLQGRSLRCPDGLVTWLREAAPEFVKETLLTAHGSVGIFDVEVAFAWRPRASAPLVGSFMNYLETPEGGSHVRGLIVAIENVIGAKRASRTKKVVGGLVAVVHVGTKYPQLQHRGRRLDDDNARNAVRDVVTRAINQAPWWWDKLHAAVG